MLRILFLVFVLTVKLLSAQDSDSVLTGKNVYKTLFAKPEKTFQLSGPLKLQLKAQFADLKEIELEKILKHHHLLYFPENGTGRLYTLDSNGHFTRLDQTKHGGDRFGAFVFFYKDTLYSVGGYGFWHINSAVRFFDPHTKDWTPLYIKRSVAVASGVNALFFYDQKIEKLFVLHGNYEDEYLKQEKDSQKTGLILDILDLKTKQWNDKSYRISKTFAKDFSEIKILAATDQLLLLNTPYHPQTLALDFKNNQVMEVASSFITAFKQIQDQHPLSIYADNDSAIIVNDIQKQETITQVLTPLLSKKLYALYQDEQSSPFSLSPFLISLCINILLIMLLAIIWLRKPKKQLNAADSAEVDEPLMNTKSKGFLDLLNETELQIVQAITEDFRAQRFTSIDKINKILGIEKRPYKIKNNLRADVLKIINKKFMDYLGNDDELIIRERSEFDKRFFEYTINERYVNKIIFKKEQGVE